jgi:hypothetical protein
MNDNAAEATFGHDCGCKIDPRGGAIRDDRCVAKTSSEFVAALLADI